MKLIAEKTSLECILWSGLNIAFYVKHKTGEAFEYVVNYNNSLNSLIRYNVQFLTKTVQFETISQVLDFIESYDRDSVELIELELFN
jgi:hypothetical protein